MQYKQHASKERQSWYIIKGEGRKVLLLTAIIKINVIEQTCLRRSRVFLVILSMAMFRASLFSLCPACDKNKQGKIYLVSFKHVLVRLAGKKKHNRWELRLRTERTRQICKIWWIRCIFYRGTKTYNSMSHSDGYNPLWQTFHFILENFVGV